ncbi:hypothetical protein MMC28_011054 [Mycoblastus sanguinarius]|nr:hypothetical protein [Mycoblastus sanguinarius]
MGFFRRLFCRDKTSPKLPFKREITQAPSNDPQYPPSRRRCSEDSLESSGSDEGWYTPAQTSTDSAHSFIAERTEHDVSIGTSYVYDKLKGSLPLIRVLVLAPAAFEDEDIHCTLRTTLIEGNLKRRPRYEVLSYTWGDSQEKQKIYVNGHSFDVTPNLHVAMRHLRCHSKPRKLWVDAVCINQDDLQERSHQVHHMYQIYSNAARVLVWLGESHPDTNKAMDFLKSTVINTFAKDSEVAPFIPGLAKIYNRPWLSRMWVVQEIAAAKRPPLVGCGKKWISWTSFNSSSFDLAWDETRDEPNEIIQNPFALMLFSTIPSGFSDHSQLQRKDVGRLENLPSATCDRVASNPKDRVFALLGITNTDIKERLVPDYKMSCSLVYQKAMLITLES